MAALGKFGPCSPGMTFGPTYGGAGAVTSCTSRIQRPKRNSRARCVRVQAPALPWRGAPPGTQALAAESGTTMKHEQATLRLIGAIDTVTGSCYLTKRGGHRGRLRTLPAYKRNHATFPAQPIERISADDLMSLAADTGSAPMQVGAILTLSMEPGQTPALFLDRLARRIHVVPRLLQRLIAVPTGCGRPVWMKDARFDPDHHLGLARCPAPGGEEGVLRIAADTLVTPLPHDRPLWVAKLITGIDQDPHHAALVFVFHHVLTDGIGGLAVLQTLAGPEGEGHMGEEPAPPFSPLLLAADNARNHLKGLAQLPASLKRLAAGTWELRVPGRTHLPRTSLNQPTGPRRQLAVLRFELEAVKTAARAQGATVNDLVLTATAAALNKLLLGRGESVDEFVISVPFSARRQTTINHLGNQNGVIPVPVPAVGPAHRRLGAVAAATRAAKRQPPGASNALLGPLSRLLARIGGFRYVIDHQRLVHTFVSDLRGPEQLMRLSGARVTGIIPLGAISGNVTVAFAVLSYAGTLAITAIADPEACPDRAELCKELPRQMQDMTKPDET